LTADTPDLFNQLTEKEKQIMEPLFKAIAIELDNDIDLLSENV
jgi:hypothetical protein